MPESACPNNTAVLVTNSAIRTIQSNARFPVAWLFLMAMKVEPDYNQCSGACESAFFPFTRHASAVDWVAIFVHGGTMSVTLRKIRQTVFFIFLFSPIAAAQAQVDRIEVNQAIGIQKNNALKFVAGKDTAVRAFLASAIAVDPAQTKADITRIEQGLATPQ